MYLNYYKAAVLCLFALGCNTPAAKTSKSKDIATTVKIDTTKSFKIEGAWATPKPSTKFNSFFTTGSDTLGFAICADYVYSPFGLIKTKSNFNSSLLRKFSVVNKVITDEGGPIELQVLKHGSSKLIFFFNSDPEAWRHSDIFKGEIYDADVEFVNGLKIGVDVDTFYKAFFDYFPDQLKNKYKIFAIDSCVDGIRHIYSFENGKLKSVSFITDYTFKADY